MNRESKMAKKSPLGSVVRKRLSDITNMPSKPKSQIRNHENPPAISFSSKEYIDQLLKENAALVKLLAERNKIIESNGIELQKMRNGFHKMQMQNWNLAQSNSQMLAELNLSRDRLKTLQHDLECKSALLKSKNLELEEKAKVGEKTGFSEDAEPGEPSKNKATSDYPNRRLPVRCQSMGPCTKSKQVPEKETVDDKRRSLKRQSASFRQHEEPTEDLFEIEDTNFRVNQPVDNMTHEEKVAKCLSRNYGSDTPRPLIGRPTRRAVEKVQCYKEVSLKVKMRRSE